MKHLLSYWTLDIPGLIILVAICIWYGLFVKPGRNQITCFLLAATIIVICFFSPLQVLSAHYLFSMHMVVHVMLLLLAGPLLVMSLPADGKHFNKLFNYLSKHPVAGWLTGVGIMWLWHVPVVFNAVMDHSNSLAPLWHGIERASLIFAGILFSAPVIHPNNACKIHALPGVVYLFTACIGCSILGLLVTFAPEGTYRHYLAMHDSYGLNQLITMQWGLTMAKDQQAAGLIMWVPCCFIYVSAAMYLLVTWLNRKESLSLQINKS